MSIHGQIQLELNGVTLNDYSSNHFLPKGRAALAYNNRWGTPSMLLKIGTSSDLTTSDMAGLVAPVRFTNNHPAQSWGTPRCEWRSGRYESRTKVGNVWRLEYVFKFEIINRMYVGPIRELGLYMGSSTTDEHIFSSNTITRATIQELLGKPELVLTETDKLFINYKILAEVPAVAIPIGTFDIPDGNGGITTHTATRVQHVFRRDTLPRSAGASELVQFLHGYEIRSYWFYATRIKDTWYPTPTPDAGEDYNYSFDIGLAAAATPTGIRYSMTRSASGDDSGQNAIRYVTQVAGPIYNHIVFNPPISKPIGVSYTLNFEVPL